MSLSSCIYHYLFTSYNTQLTDRFLYKVMQKEDNAFISIQSTDIDCFIQVPNKRIYRSAESRFVKQLLLFRFYIFWTGKNQEGGKKGENS